MTTSVALKDKRKHYFDDDDDDPINFLFEEPTVAINFPRDAGVSEASHVRSDQIRTQQLHLTVNRSLALTIIVVRHSCAAR